MAAVGKAGSPSMTWNHAISAGRFTAGIGAIGVMVFGMILESYGLAIGSGVLMALGGVLDGVGLAFGTAGELLRGTAISLLGIAAALLITVSYLDANLVSGLIDLSEAGKFLLVVAFVLSSLAVVIGIQGNSSYRSTFWAHRWWMQTIWQHNIARPFLTPFDRQSFSYDASSRQLEDIRCWSVQAQNLMLQLGSEMRTPSSLGLNWLTIIGTLILSFSDFFDDVKAWIFDETGLIFLSHLITFSGCFISIVGIVAWTNFQVNGVLEWVHRKTLDILEFQDLSHRDGRSGARRLERMSRHRCFCRSRSRSSLPARQPRQMNSIS